MMKISEQIDQFLSHVKGFPEPLSNYVIDRYGSDPYLILISCLISLRTRDRVTIYVCDDLFARVQKPSEMVLLDRDELETIIFKSGFYKTKAKVLQEVSQALLDRFDGIVPNDQEKLLSLPGVGLKTANLVLGVAFDVPAICVDTHVHKISNLLGLVKSTDPDKTEAALRSVLPKKHWIEWNYVCVMMGQNGCLTKKGCGKGFCPLKKVLQLDS